MSFLWCCAMRTRRRRRRKNVQIRVDHVRTQRFHDVVDGLAAREITPPVLLRFGDLLGHRLWDMARVFREAIENEGYNGSYACVYPIKVNQQRHLVEEVLTLGHPYGFGIEAGSKPELIAAIGMTAHAPDTLIICNGFKDDEYIETVVLAQKFGRRIIPVVEKFAELTMIIEHAQRLRHRPILGIRVKLSASGIGRWRSSAGVRSKFGLFASEALDALELLKQIDMADCLQLLHCHAGSQICDIRYLKSTLSELSHIYTELFRLGAGLKYLDIGGGLGVDYDGTRSNFESSVNYTLAEYATDTVYRIKLACDQKEVPHPIIITESGRATVAYSTLMIVEVAGAAGFDRFTTPEDPRKDADVDLPAPLMTLLDTYDRVHQGQIAELYHDAVQGRDEALNLFSLGYLDLALRSVAEKLFWSICTHLQRRIKTSSEEFSEDELEALPNLLSDTYYCNFSVFQSTPDAWAIDQLFPIVPIHRLDEAPSRRAVLADITCDSDGKIDRFVGEQGLKTTLELHELTGEPYYLGVFLVGAYQETLGDLHNLFGDTNAVHISVDEKGNWAVDALVEGDSVAEVLSYFQYEPAHLLEATRREAENAVRSGTLSIQESNQFLKLYRAGMQGYTYLESEQANGLASHSLVQSAVASPSQNPPRSDPEEASEG
jgi:arginine decarboxylase